jgi:DNA polymerase I
MLLVFDGNNLAWAGFHALRRPMKAETPAQKTRASLLGMTQMIVSLVVRGGEPPAASGRQAPADPNPLAELVVAFDEGRPIRRRSVFPAYQLGRESDPSFMDNEPFILDAILQFSEAARSLPLTLLRGKDTEADDLIAAHVLSSSRDCVRIVSTDRDFLQLVDERLSIYAPVKRVVIDSSNFSEMTAPRGTDDRPVAFPRERFLDYRAASGDASDNLPGIAGVGALTAAKLLALAPLDAYFDDPHLVAEALGRRNPKLEATLATSEARQAVQRNRALMDLREAAKGFPDLSPYERPGSWDEPVFRAWVKDQRIAGIEFDAACRAFASVAQHV